MSCKRIQSKAINLVLTLAVLFLNVQLSIQDATVSIATNNANAQIETPPTIQPVSDEIKKFEEFKKSNVYLPPFESDVYSIPEVQLEYVKSVVKADLDLYREILREAIDKRNNIAPSVSLMWKYSGKLLSNFIKNRRGEQKLDPHKEPKPSFFGSIADLAQTVIDKSADIKKAKGYNKKSVDTDELYHRVDAVLNYIEKTINTSPIGAYLKWNEMVLFKGETSRPNHDLDFVEETADLVAQFRGMGYESCIFVARRIVNLLKIFSRGIIPSSDNDV